VLDYYFLITYASNIDTECVAILMTLSEVYRTRTRRTDIDHTTLRLQLPSCTNWPHFLLSDAAGDWWCPLEWRY